MTVPQLLVLLSAASCFASYGWGLARFFASPDRETGTELVKWGTVVGVLAHLVAIVFFYQHGAVRFPIALALYAVSLGIFWWAVRAFRGTPPSIAYSQDQPTRLMTAGPYGFVRHPLYTSYGLCWIAGVVATGQPVLLLTVVIMGWLYHYAVLAEEAKFAASPLARDYALYAQRVGRYLPRLKALG